MKHRIVLVDDDRNILTSVTMALEAEGFDVHARVDGEQAWPALRSNGVDLAVPDIRMARMDGGELPRRPRSKTTRPVMFLTTKIGERDEEFGPGMGADDHMGTPCQGLRSPQRLPIARIRALLRRKEPDRHGGGAAIRRRTRRWYRSPPRRRLPAANLSALAILAVSLLPLGGYRREPVETERRPVEVRGRTIALALGRAAAALPADGAPGLDTKSAEALPRRLIEEFGLDGTLQPASRRFSGFGDSVESGPLPPAGEPNLFGAALRRMPGPFDPVFRELEAIEPHAERAGQRASDHENGHRTTRRPEGRCGVKRAGRPLARRKGPGAERCLAQPELQARGGSGNGSRRWPGHRRGRGRDPAGYPLRRRRGAGRDRPAHDPVARGIATPPGDLAATAERVRPGSGRADIREPSGRNDGIGDLFAARRRMAHALREGMCRGRKFAADVSHELGTPPASTCSAADTARREADPARRRQLMQIVPDDYEAPEPADRQRGGPSRSRGAIFARGSPSVDMRGMVETRGEAEAAPQPALTVAGLARRARPRGAAGAGRPQPDRQCGSFSPAAGG